ncbi:hypothetical protein HZC00_05300 [Candidatus Kaiserbacteria bacterium]|nr:hypothetical protein [Candidatus Kaiserbacteria bacterium]
MSWWTHRRCPILTFGEVAQLQGGESVIVHGVTGLVPVVVTAVEEKTQKACRVHVRVLEVYAHVYHYYHAVLNVTEGEGEIIFYKENAFWSTVRWIKWFMS